MVEHHVQVLVSETDVSGSHAPRAQPVVESIAAVVVCVDEHALGTLFPEVLLCQTEENRSEPMALCVLRDDEEY